MTETGYVYFMVFQLHDSGEREKLDIEEDELESILDPEKVFVIVKEGIRRIFIWKGAKSPVRKRFISSRVAGGLQEELVKEANFHRCKIVSVDQGDEVVEFLQAFNLESMEVDDRLQDMRYIRNVERDATASMGQVVDSTTSQDEEEQEYYSPALEELKRKGVDVSAEMNSTPSTKKTAPPKNKKPRRTKPRRSSPSKSTRRTPRKVDKDSLIKKVLETEVPKDFQRQNLIIGKQLYGAVSKTTNVFGENVEKTNWEFISSVPDGIFLLRDYIFRIYFNPEKGMLNAVEILKDESNSKMEQSNLDIPDSDGKLSKQILDLDTPEGYTRINLIEGHKLYGATTKTVNVFGEEQEEIAWDLIDSIPKELISLDDHLFRVFFDSKNEIVRGIEVLKKGKSTEKSKILAQKDDTSKKETKNNSKKSKRRDLPSIPSGEN